MTEAIEVRRLTTDEEFDAVAHLREHIHLPESNLTAAELAAKERYCDHHSVVFAFEKTQQIIGTIRLIPFGLGLSPCENIVIKMGHDKLIDPHSCEIGRLIIVPEHRDNSRTLALCFHLCVQYAANHCAFTKGFAICSHALVRLYRRFGMVLLEEDVVSNDRSYSLIYTDLDTVIRAN